MRDGVTVRWDDERVRFELRPDGRWRRIEEEWTGCTWRPRGSEIVDEIEFEISAGGESGGVEL